MSDGSRGTLHSFFGNPKKSFTNPAQYSNLAVNEDLSKESSEDLSVPHTTPPQVYSTISQGFDNIKPSSESNQIAASYDNVDNVLSQSMQPETLVNRLSSLTDTQVGGVVRHTKRRKLSDERENGSSMEHVVDAVDNGTIQARVPEPVSQPPDVNLASVISADGPLDCSEKSIRDAELSSNSLSYAEFPPSNDLPSSTPPVKMLKLNASGTLGTPTSKKTDEQADVGKGQRRRGRPKKEKHLVGKCCYKEWPSALEVGQKIDRIMSNRERFIHPSPGNVKRQAGKSSALQVPPKPSKSLGPPKVTHPFFGGKPQNKAGLSSKPRTEEQSHNNPSPRKSFASTPGKIRLQVQLQKAAERGHDISNDEERSIRKPNDSRYVVWPTNDAMHVRGELDFLDQPSARTDMSRRKMKYQTTSLDAKDGIIHQKANLVQHYTTGNRRQRPDGFINPPASLRIPNKLLISGSQIRLAVDRELSDQLTHPALLNTYNAIKTSLTPFDEGRSEILPWTQKYAPKSAEEVLLSGTEASILRDWMKELKVTSVDFKSSQLLGSKSTTNGAPHRKKRRKKAQDLDDFIVSDEDDGGRLETVYDAGELSASQGDDTSGKRTLVYSGSSGPQSVSNPRKNINAVVISGPHGCGKTSMVHAVAKELGFQLFEINSGSRRSGRDILERVGDMVENHLVTRQAVDTGNTSADEDAARVSKAFKKDLESGRQGTMNTFFQAKAKSSQKARVPVPKTDPGPPQVKLDASTKTNKTQKQSVILLEEVDILFEQDKNFWITVLELIVNSKRPVVMTCTNENALPLQELNLHAILRLSTPTSAIVTDYLLLMAAKEGHLVKRSAVTYLLDLKRHDLRASITELQFWCQMGVGDPRGGLSWIFQRWPPGVGESADGQKQRVISQGVYPEGIGSLAREHDSMSDTNDQYRLLEAWDYWHVDPRIDLHSAISEQYDNEDLSATTSPASRFKALKHMEQLCDSMSTIDVLSRVNMPDPDQSLSRYSPLGSVLRETILDPTQPKMSEKARVDHVQGYVQGNAVTRLIQADEETDFTGFSSDLIVAACHYTSHTFGTGKPLLNMSRDYMLQRITQNDKYGHAVRPLSREVFSAAFHPISEVAAHTQTFALTYSAFDGPLSTISTDIAPYIRGIVHYDLALEEQRLRLSHVLNGHAPATATGKKGRTTRAARSALEGGARELTRRERWFPPELDLNAVLKTGGQTWPNAVLMPTGSVGDASQDPYSLPGSQVEHVGSQEDVTIPEPELDVAMS